MSIEVMIGVAYCLVALIFIIGMMVKAHKNRDFREPEQIITASHRPVADLSTKTQLVRALRILGQATIHSTSRHVDFHFYVHTACNLRVDWKAALHETVTLDPDDDILVIAEPVDEPVDCMTCLVNMAREQDRVDYFTNPCAEIELNK